MDKCNNDIKRENSAGILWISSGNNEKVQLSVD